MQATKQLANLIDRERSRLEAIGVRRALQVSRILRAAAVASFRDGMTPIIGVRNAVHRANLKGLVVDAMVAAHLSGYRRSMLIASTQFRAKDRMKLAGTVYDDAIDFLLKRLDLGQDQIAVLKAAYDGPAATITDGTITSLETRLQKTVIQSVQQGDGLRQGIGALRQAFKDEGFAPEADYRLETMFRTQTQIAYSAGRDVTRTDPELADLFWGFEYVTVWDDRRTETCAALDGMKRPKDDPVWMRLTPPNHYNCRSSRIEVIGDATPTDIPDVQAAPGFGFNAGSVLAIAA